MASSKTRTNTGNVQNLFSGDINPTIEPASPIARRRAHPPGTASVRMCVPLDTYADLERYALVQRAHALAIQKLVPEHARARQAYLARMGEDNLLAAARAAVRSAHNRLSPRPSREIIQEIQDDVSD